MLRLRPRVAKKNGGGSASRRGRRYPVTHGMGEEPAKRGRTFSTSKQLCSNRLEKGSLQSIPPRLVAKPRNFQSVSMRTAFTDSRPRAPLHRTWSRDPFHRFIEGGGGGGKRSKTVFQHKRAYAAGITPLEVSWTLSPPGYTLIAPSTQVQTRSLGCGARPHPASGGPSSPAASTCAHATTRENWKREHGRLQQGRRRCIDRVSQT